MSIYHLIPSDRWISRAELCHESGKCDRMVRREINELRKNPDTIIVSSSHGKGYKRPSSVEELEACLYESISRVKDEEEKQRILKQAIRSFHTRSKSEQLYFDF